MWHLRRLPKLESLQIDFSKVCKLMLTCRVNNREAAPLTHTELIALLLELDLIRYRSVVVKIASATKSNQLLRFDRKPELF